MPRTPEQQRGVDFEKEVANLLGGKVQPGSGNKFYAKNDVIANGLSVSCKSMTSMRWGLIKQYLNESINDTIGTGNIPALAIDDGNGDHNIVMRLSDFVKACSGDIKIYNSVISKGITKREEADIPLMLR